MDSAAFQKIRTLVSLRLLFCVVLLTATIILNISRSSQSFNFLYILIGGIFLLSLIYSVLLRYGKASASFTFIQTAIDTVIVSIILLLTGASNSIFSFLYLIVIIYSSMILYQKSSFFIAALSAGQYALVVLTDMTGMTSRFILGNTISAHSSDWSLAMYKIVFTSVACFAVAWLGNMLTEQNRKNRIRMTHLEEQVRRVEKMAMLGEMAAGMAHEIKNPLASLAGAIQMLEKDLNLSSDQSRLMRIVLRETERLTELLNNYLLFAKPQAGKVEKIPLHKAVEETQRMIRKNSRFRENLSVEWQIPENISVEMDPSHLRQILWNLLLNAAESSSGGCRVDIHGMLNGEKRVKLTIQDNGCGIEPGHLSLIFDPFFTTKPHGTGLGLPIVHRILQSYNGAIDVESDLHQGTTFKVELPALLDVK